MEGEVEGVEGLVVRQPGQLQRVAEPPALADPDLLFEDEVEELQVAQLRGLGPLCQRFGVLGEMGESEPGGVPADPVQHQRLAAHAAPPTLVRPAAWS